MTQYDEPTAIELVGRGRGGVRITVAMQVTDRNPGSTFQLSAELGGGLLNGPIGKLVAKMITSDVREVGVQSGRAGMRRPVPAANSRRDAVPVALTLADSTYFC